MASIFTKIIAGELPGHFIWKDDVCVSFMTIAPLQPGHAMVIPREEVDHWIDVPEDHLQHLISVAQKVGQAIQSEFNPTKVGMIVLGLEVPHTHIHLSPIWKPTDLDFHNANSKATAEQIGAAADKLRAALRAAGHGEFVVD